jgi:hypothetical protein
LTEVTIGDRVQRIGHVLDVESEHLGVGDEDRVTVKPLCWDERVADSEVQRLN